MLGILKIIRLILEGVKMKEGHSEPSNNRLKNLAEILAADAYGYQGVSSALLEKNGLLDYTTLATVFAVGMHANLKKRVRAGEEPERLNGEVLDRLSRKHVPPDIAKDLQDTYKAQYAKLTAADESLAGAMGIENAFIKNAKLNARAMNRSLKAHALRSDSEIPKAILEYTDMMIAGVRGSNAGLIKLIYHAGFAAANYIDISQHTSTLGFLQKTAQVSSLGMYMFNQIGKISGYAANLVTVGAAGALDAVFAHLTEHEKSKLESVDIRLVVLDTTITALADFEVAREAAFTKLDKERSLISSSEQGVKDVLFKKPLKLGKVADLQMKQEAVELSPCLVSITDFATSFGSGVQAVTSKLVYQSVNIGVGLMLSGLQRVGKATGFTR